MDRLKINKETKVLLNELFEEKIDGRTTVYISWEDYFFFHTSGEFWSGGYKSITRVIENNGQSLKVSAPKTMTPQGFFLNPITMEHSSKKIPLGADRFVVQYQYAGTKKYVHIYASEENRSVIAAPARKQLT